jgi:hypothetical protein
MVEYLVHGIRVDFLDQECGLYKPNGAVFDYAVMDPDHLVRAINGMPKDVALEQVAALRELAAGQVALREAPANLGSPILRVSGHQQVPLDQVRGNIQHLVDLTDKILEALGGAK